MSMPAFDDEVYGEVHVVPHNFRIAYKPVPGKPGEFTERHMVDLIKRGTTNSVTPMYINALKQDPVLWPAVEPAYEAWLKGQEAPVEGTPIDVLPFLPPPLIDHYKQLHLRTAEELSEATDADLERMGMGARKFRDMARQYIDNAPGADTAARIAVLEQERDTLSQQVQELTEQVNQLANDAVSKKTRRKGADDDA